MCFFHDLENFHDSILHKFGAAHPFAADAVLTHGVRHLWPSCGMYSFLIGLRIFKDPPLLIASDRR